MATMTPEDLRSTSDLASMEGLNEQRLDDALSRRYASDVIYTYIGDILIAVNPYRMLPLYTDDVSSRYCRMPGKAVQPPHLYAIADSAYQQMRRGNQPQVAVITGESGAGKTESTKHFIRQIMDVSNAGVGASSMGGEEGADGNVQVFKRKRHPIEDQIMQTNPILEAFGNAQTVMNDNSSRFGKFIELKFNRLGTVNGASMSHYLLEKARVVKQGPGERNYHIFELLLVGGSDLASKLKLSASASYGYVANRDPNTARLKEEWAEVSAAMPKVGFTAEETESMWHIVAAILHLGNVTFKESSSGDTADVATPDVLANVAANLGVQPDSIKEGMMTSKIQVGSETIIKELNVDKSKTSRDAVAKALYDRLFCWLVARLDMMLCPAEARNNDSTTIGILDIFGFEDFESNGFDQLCINLANEQLHSFFNTHIFASEIQAYNDEGVDGAAVLFSDNKSVVDLFYRRPQGLLAILDEESFFPSATDKTLMEKLDKQLEELEAFEMNKGGYAFLIRHFAGPITYQGEGLLEKNKDPLPNRMADCMADADNALVQLLFRDNYLAEVRGDAKPAFATSKARRSMVPSIRGSRRPGKAGKGKRGGAPSSRGKRNKTDKQSVSSQFSESLSALMIRMNRCLPHFVRCIKPNPDKLPKKYVGEMVRKQLKYTGMLQTIEMRREGYPDRKTFRELLATYAGIVYPFSKRIEYTRRQAEDFMTKCQAKQAEVVQAKKLSGKTVHLNNWIVAKTKVFLKYWHTDVLDTLMRPFDSSAVVVQKWVRRFVARSKFLRVRREYRDQLATAANFIQDIKTNGNILFSAQQTLIEEEKRRGPEGLGLVKKVTKKEEEKMKKAMLKDAAATVAGKPANAKKLAKAMENMNKAAVKWWHKYEARRNEHIDSQGKIHPWFHGLISRKDAENFLFDEDEGTFLIRVSERANGYAISFHHHGRVRHYKISHSPLGGYIVMGSDDDFASLSDLVEHYQSNPLSDEGDVISDPLLLEHELNLDIGASNASGGDGPKRPKMAQSYEQFTPRGKGKGARRDDDDMDDADEDDATPMTERDYLEDPAHKPNWLRGKLGRAEAEKELLERGLVDGRFMVRIKSQAPTCIIYALSYTFERRYYHHLLTKKKRGNFTLNDRPLKVPHLEACIRKFQDRQYPGLATRLEASAPGAIAQSKVTNMNDFSDTESSGNARDKGNKKKDKKDKRKSKPDLPARHYKL